MTRLVNSLAMNLCCLHATPHSPDKNKVTVQVLRDHSDVWHIGKESIDMRVSRKAFVRVQTYFSECTVIIEDLEAHVQAAEAMMFPQKKAEQEAWLQAVVQAVMPKVSSVN